MNAPRPAGEQRSDSGYAQSPRTRVVARHPRISAGRSLGLIKPNDHAHLSDARLEWTEEVPHSAARETRQRSSTIVFAIAHRHARVAAEVLDTRGRIYGH